MGNPAWEAEAMKTTIRTLAFVTIGAWFVVLCGCGGGGNPVQPDDKPAKIAKSTSGDLSRQLWGMWDIGIDVETLSATVMPSRNVETHFNVLPFLTPPNCSDCFKLHVNSFDEVTRILDVDVTLRNKFELSGYDVRGILFTDDQGHLLKNEDAWTALFDIPGGDTINPFKAYAKDDPQRIFPGLAELTENYKIWVPDPPEYFMIKYAVDASYPTNCLEPYAFENFTQEQILAVPGSHGIISVDVKDWQGDADSVSLYAPDLNDSALALTHQSGDTWSGDFTNLNAATVGEYAAKITATSTNSGATCLYYFTTITVSEPAQPGWARTWGGSDYDIGYAAAMDASGNVYVTGSFKHTVDFDPGIGVDNHTASGPYAAEDIFLSKYDSSGNFIWARTWGSIYTDEGLGITVDGAGNPSVTGYFGGTADFDPGSGVDNHTAEQDAVFLSVFDSSGNFNWARTWGEHAGDWGYGIGLDESGSVYVTGLFSYTVDFDPGSGIDDHVSNGDADIFLTKFDSSGDYQWARTWGTTGWDGGLGAAVDGSGNAYVSGASSGHAFLSKFDSSGNLKWAHTLGGEGALGVALDDSGNVYITGYFLGSADFDPGDGVDLHISNGPIDMFVCKFDSLGNFQWASTWGGNAYDFGRGIAVDGSDNSYVTGNVMGDIFLCKFDMSGSFMWSRTWGSIYDDSGYGIAADGVGNTYMTGYFCSTLDFDPGSGVDNHTSNGGGDVFLSKFDSNGNW